MSLNKKIAFYTLGCKVNQYETESIKNQLINLGYSEVPFDEISDIYIVNSCTVTSIADKKTRNMLRRAKKLNPKGIVILTGCYAQTNSNDLKEIEEIDYIVGNKDKQGIINLIKDLEDKNLERVINENIFSQEQYEEYEFATLREMSRAYIKIQDGCNSFCSYCKIPFARGKSRSRKLENIIDEIKKVTSQGYKEIILIGINIGAYGEDFNKNISFEDLVEEIIKIDDVERLRFGSIYPDKINDRFISLFRSAKLLPHIHLSLQSGDDTILEKMRRKYNSSLIVERCKALKNAVKDMEITADVIVGFPGETEQMFRNSYETIRNVEFSDLHVFQYSDREGTLAATMPDKIGSVVKKMRADELEKLRVDMEKNVKERYIGKELDVLIEENSEDGAVGYTSNYLKVKIKNESLNIGEIYKISMKEIKGGVFVGEKSN